MTSHHIISITSEILNPVQICETLSQSKDWTSGWDNYSSTAYVFNKDHVVVYDNVEAIVTKVPFESVALL